jgi:hypothetical protein
MINKVILCVLLALSGGFAAADSSADFAPPPPPPAPAVKETNATAKPPSINPAAQMGQSSQSSGSMMNMLASAALFAACFSSNPPNMPLCAMGALAAMQGGADAGAAAQSADTFAASSKDSTLNKPAGNPAFGTASGGGFSDPKIKQGMDALKNAGYTVTDTGVTGPDGSFTPTSAFSSPAAMAAAGMDQGTIDASQKALASVDASALANAAKVSSVGVAEGGGAAGAAGNGGNYEAGGSGPYNPFALNSAQKKQMVAGKTVMFDGEPIGVKGQNLFDMVHVAYERKRQNNHFLENASGGVSTRTPASAPKKR